MRSPIVSSYIELPWNVGVLILYISDIKSCEFVKQNSAESFARATKNGMAATAGEGLLRVLCIHVFCVFTCSVYSRVLCIHVFCVFTCSVFSALYAFYVGLVVYVFVVSCVSRLGDNSSERGDYKVCPASVLCVQWNTL